MLKLVEIAANDTAEAYRALLAKARIAQRKVVEARVQRGASFAEREAAFLEVGNEISRQNLEEELQSTADAHTEALFVEGVLYRRHQDGNERYHSLCAGLRVRRATYRRVGERNGPTVPPWFHWNSRPGSPNERRQRWDTALRWAARVKRLGNK
ncbi:MAG: hypothetical protein V3V08_00705 [Nannocystaceae bacterium]